MREHSVQIEVLLTGLALLTALSVLGLQPGEKSAAAGPEERSVPQQEEPVIRTAVIAHRAGAALAPENTLAALEAAIAAGADMAEIDVRQTGDGVLVALHDDSFGRTAGLDKKVWELDCPSAQKLDAGSWYSHQFQGEHVPTLEEMLAAARGGSP